MSCIKLNSVHIDAVFTSVPEKNIHIQDEIQYYGNSEKRVDRTRKMIGTDRRCIAWPGITAADLCFDAATRLIADCKIDKSTIDALIFVTQTPDYDLPASACILQNALGLSTSCAAFDVNQGCSGYVYGLWLAAGLIASGACARVLLLAGEAADYYRNPDNRIIAPIFGDGGSATLLSRHEGVSPMSFLLGTDGSGHGAIIRPAGRARLPYSRIAQENACFFEDIYSENGTPWRLNEVYMDGAKVFEFTINSIPKHIKEFMQQAEVTPESIDWLLLHQANKQIVDVIGEKAGFPMDKVPSRTFSRYGNLSSASIPAAICDLFSEQSMSGRESILLCGYGVGLSWASCLFEAKDIICSPVHTYSVSAALPDRNALINHWSNILKGKETPHEN